MRDGRRLLACSSSGGHFKQLVRIVRRIPDIGSVTWLTYDSGLAADILQQAGYVEDRLVFAPYAAPRDVRNLARDATVVRRLLREQPYDLAVSAGAGIAVAALPLARMYGVRACFVESAARTTGPSLSGRILRRTPGIELFAQSRHYSSAWKFIGSVCDDFARGPDREHDRKVTRAVVTLGTSEAFGFRRLVERLTQILPREVDVLWQTGATDTRGLDIEAHARVPGPDLEAAINRADVVVAHAGLGSALTAFELGRSPILVPRRREFGENIDDHQEITGKELMKQGLALCVEADELSMQDIRTAAARCIVPRSAPPEVAI